MARSHTTTFPKSLVTSLFTTALDFGVLVGLVEVFHVEHVLAVFLGTVVGSMANFLVNRYWAFRADSGHAGWQAGRFLVVQAGASGIHTLGVWVLMHFLWMDYLVAKVATAAFAYLVWNYPMNHHFVFPANQSTRRSRATA